MSDQIPLGWISTVVGNVTEHVASKNPRDYPNREFGYVDISSIDNLTFAITKVMRIKGCDAPSRARRPIEPNDVLFANVRTYLRNIAIVPSRSDADLCSTGFTVLRPNAAILPRFLFRYVLSDDFIDRVTLTQTGSHYPATSDSAVLAESILLPPIAEQRRIVAELERLLAKSDVCQRRLSNISICLRRFRRAVLAAACSGRLTAEWRKLHPETPSASALLSEIAEERYAYEPRKVKVGGEVRKWNHESVLPETWAVCSLDDLAAPKPHAIKAGPFGSSLTKADYVPSGFKVYGQEQVIRGDSEFGDYYVNDDKFKELQTCEVSAGDVLVSLVGTIGKVLIIPEKYQRGIINPRLAKLSLHQSINREYVADFLRSPLAVEVFSNESHGGTMEILNLKMLRGLAIPLPPISEQSEIVRLVKELLEFANKVEARIKTVERQVDRLPQSILAKAFRGELVPTEAELAKREGRTYESAEQLLERIHSEKAQSNSKNVKASPTRKRRIG